MELFCIVVYKKNDQKSETSILTLRTIASVGNPCIIITNILDNLGKIKQITLYIMLLCRSSASAECTLRTENKQNCPFLKVSMNKGFKRVSD